LRAIERAGSTNNLRVIKALEGHRMPAADRMQHFDAYIDAATHQVQQTIYLARRNTRPVNNTDLFEIISWTSPENALDDAAPGKCRLKPDAEIPSYDP
jgi:branched-chain amino acid transport system substrate-binding protein